MKKHGVTLIEVALVALVVLVALIAFLMILALDMEASETVTATSRPTTPPGTPTYNVFLPLALKDNLTPTATPRPTARSK